MPKPTRCISPSDMARSTGRKRPGRSFTMSMPRAILSALKSCRPARFSRQGTGKKLSRRARRAPAQLNSGTPLHRPGLDLCDSRIRAEIRREVKLMAQHPENAAIDDWIEQVYDWESWK